MSPLLFALLAFAQQPAFPPPGVVPPPEQLTREDKTVLEAAQVLQEIQAVPDRCIPAHLLKEAQGIVILPGLKKVGFFVEGHFGRGIAVVRRADGSWSSPIFCRITGGGFGAQAGIEAQDLVLVCKTQRSMRWLYTGAEITLDVNAGVAAGPVGRGATAGTNLGLNAEMFSYSRSRGLFAGVAASGGRLRVENSADAAYYRAPGIGVREILKAENLPVPASAVKFQQVLAEASKAPPVEIGGPPPASLPPAK